MKTIYLHSLRLFTLCWLLTFFSSLSIAQKEADSTSINVYTLEQLMETKISVNKTSETLKKSSGNIYVITEDDIISRGYKDLKDILDDLPGITYVANAGNVYMTEIRMRGIMGNNRIVVLRDGIRLNNPSGVVNTWGNNMPLNDVKQIEIMINPASVVYGHDTYSAVINIKTKRREHYNVEMTAGSYNTYVPAFSLSHPTKKGYLFMSGRAYFSAGQDRAKEYPEMYEKDVEALKTKIPNWQDRYSEKDLKTNAYVEDYNYHVEYKYDKLTIGGMFMSLKEVNSLSHLPKTYLVNHESPIYTRQYNLYANYESKISSKLESKTTLTYLNEFRGDDYGFTYVDKNAIYGTGYKKFFNSMDVASQIEQQFNYIMSNKINFNLGVNAEDILTIPQAQSFLVQTNPIDRKEKDGYKYQNFGVYLQNVYKINKLMTLYAGARLDYNTNYKWSHNPRLTLVIQPTNKLTLKAMYGKAYLAPSTKDMFFVNSGTTFLQMANKDLKPEEIRTSEININYLATRFLSFETKLFFSNASNIVSEVLVSKNDTFQTTKKLNINTIESYGGELVIKAEISKKLKISTWYAYMDGLEGISLINKDIFEENRIIQVAHHSGNLNLTYQHNIHFGANLNLHYMGRMKTNELNTEFHGGYLPATNNINLNIFILKIFNHLNFDLFIGNILNQKQYHLEINGYGTRLPKIPQPRRHFMITVRYRF